MEYIIILDSLKPYPFITKSAEGKFLKDVDSNKYVDYWMGHWSLILGHAQKQIQKKAVEQLKKGLDAWNIK